MRRVSLIFAVVSVLFLGSAHRVWASSDHISAEQVTTDDKAFFQKIRLAVENHDAKWMAKNIGFPITVSLNGKRVPIKSEKSFITNYDIIVTKSIVDAVLSQDENDMFKNWQGIMVGHGQLWFNEYMDTDKTHSFYLIIAINN